MEEVTQIFIDDSSSFRITILIRIHIIKPSYLISGMIIIEIKNIRTIVLRRVKKI